MKSCAIPDCQLKHHSKGYCRLHYDLEVRGIGRSVQKHRRDENMQLLESGCKRCSRCREVKSLDQFSPKQGCLGGFRAECKSCMYSTRTIGRGRELKRQADERRSRRLGARSLAVRRREAEERRNLKTLAKAEGRHARAAARRQKVDAQPWLDPLLSDAEQYRLRYRLDNTFAIKERLRRQVAKQRKKLSLHDKLRSALRRGGRAPTVEALVGYSVTELRGHLEKQFTKGMDWDRFREGAIHIDHIVPVRAFDLTRDDEAKACWALSNLRPLWAADNLAKGGRVTTLL